MRASSSSSSPRCASFACHRGGDHEVHAPGQACGRPLGRAGRFVGGGIAAVFFASLEGCYCVDFPTDDDEPPLNRASRSRDVGEAAPLLPRAAAAKKSRQITATAAGKGKFSRGGFGCCENTATAN
ncbi:hypothetical protein E2562_028988 [Oryza meyeriana var. granulata]|uniref:Uncharacterized protein n=1 Tax=Oryza meyeriana var. granulata TaxID=110450 RepID=A0A6G1DQL8_9ORYZ|nr:hypothetical protein E2562_028988 [Oryza meyeriana var. granulata]